MNVVRSATAHREVDRGQGHEAGKMLPQVPTFFVAAERSALPQGALAVTFVDQDITVRGTGRVSHERLVPWVSISGWR